MDRSGANRGQCRLHLPRAVRIQRSTEPTRPDHEDGPLPSIRRAPRSGAGRMSTSTGVDAVALEGLARNAVAEFDGTPDVEAMLVAFNLIRAANRVQQDLETTVHRPAGVTWAAFRVLFIVLAVGPIPPAELARLSSVSPASISSVVNTLERNKLIVRRASTDDGRSVLVELTPRGRKLVSELWMRNNERETAWAQALSPRERAIMTRLLRKILTHRAPPPRSLVDKPK